MWIRFLWLVLVAVHVAPLLSVLSHCSEGLTANLLTKAAGILLSMGFFGAKACGARILRVRCRLTGAVVFLAACSFVHQDLRQQIYSDPSVAVSVAAVAAFGHAARRRVCARVVGSGWASLTRLLRARSWERLIEPGRGMWNLVLARVSAVPRGPPAVC